MSLRHISRVCVRAVQGIVDHNSKGPMTKPPQARPISESDNPINVRRFSGIVEPAKKVNRDEKRRKREAEKAEHLTHLICWGPN
ncbi:hypothetical protein ACSBR2_027555 [Camellia fascicularis]